MNGWMDALVDGSCVPLRVGAGDWKELERLLSGQEVTRLTTQPEMVKASEALRAAKDRAGMSAAAAATAAAKAADDAR